MTYGNYPDLKQVKRLLVVKMRHHGDVLLTSPVFSLLKQALPQALIDAFIYADTLPMLEGHPAIADFLLYDRKWKKLPFFRKIAREFLLLKQIRATRYDLVINLTEGDRGALAALVSGARYRVGFDPGSRGFLAKRKSYTHLVKSCPHPRHTVERQLDVLRRIGIFPQPHERELFLHIPCSATEKIRERLQKEGLEPGEYLIVHPVSRWRFKCLATQQIAHLLQTLHARGEKVVLSAGPDAQEREMIDEILSQVPHLPVVNLAGEMTLKELAALISLGKALICVDSVPLHIASALKTPVIALFGPTSEQNWGPWHHPRARVVAQHFPCRPCYQDGCGGSKRSDCLLTLPEQRILQALNEVSPPIAKAELAPCVSRN